MKIAFLFNNRKANYYIPYFLDLRARRSDRLMTIILRPKAENVVLDMKALYESS